MGEVDGGVERRRAPVADLVGVHDLLQLGGGRAGRLGIARGERDLDTGRQRPHPLQGLLELLERAGDPGHGALEVALRELEERQAGLRNAAVLVRRPERVVGRRELAAAATDLADLVVAARGDGAVEVVELLAGGERRLLGLGPVPAQAHDLRAVDAAGAGEAVHALLVAPPIGRLRPLGRPAEVAHVPARADRDAVDDAGRKRP